MKKFTLIDIITMVGIAASILLVLMFASGCSMKFYKQSPEDVRKCCERVKSPPKGDG
jgi:PBP1b-binding outer membrane lipoprotein LpoB